jgi:L-malate glycosyltransferase
MIKTKKPPSWIKNPLIVRMYQSKFGILFTNWLNQGMLYMLPIEAIFKLWLDIIFFFFWYFIGNLIGISLIVNVFIAAVLAHTTNWLLNGHFFNLIRFFGYKGIDEIRFVHYPQKMRRRLEKCRYISGVTIYGSLARKGKVSKSSDLDVRLIAKPGMLCAILACFASFRERLIAFFSRYPIDIYIATQEKGLEKLRKDEIPIVLVNNDKFLQQHYGKLRYYDQVKDSWMQ